MILYPSRPLETIGITAPSSGLSKELHGLLLEAENRLKRRGFKVKLGDTVWTQQFAKSAPADKRAAELMAMFENASIDFIVPPWGGELMVEVLEHLDFARIEPKWLLGYSDISGLLLAITLQTGIATAHGTNFIDLRGEEMDATTARWMDVLTTKEGESATQISSLLYQKKWDHDHTTPVVFHLTEPTVWKTVSGHREQFSGRLLGGCIDIIRHLIGTPFGNVRQFREQHIPGEPLVWYLENCELNITDLRRSLVQMKYAGWFENCSGILFGRSAANQAVDGYTAELAYKELAQELSLPIAYDIDCGHMPPQLTFVNGTFADITVHEGKGKVVQTFI
ncbi:S66 family peptidase [Planococcus sp. YIM B11945]|uniref:S66 family peptidase n=1 Tax=Planococcus sp. YIM B11945 TaxID=3435410 RepID=UPI003D7EFC4D